MKLTESSTECSHAMYALVPFAAILREAGKLPISAEYAGAVLNGAKKADVRSSKLSLAIAIAAILFGSGAAASRVNLKQYHFAF